MLVGGWLLIVSGSFGLSYFDGMECLAAKHRVADGGFGLL